MRWKQFLAQIKKQKLKPVYLFLGQETFLIDEARQEIKARLITPASAAWNYQQFYGEEAAAEDILAAANTAPAFAARRLLVAKNCERLDPTGRKLIISYKKNPCPTT